MDVFDIKDDAVSPVIGTILLVTLTIALVGIFGVVVMSFDPGEPAPILGISIGQQGNIITVTHLNGAELPAGSYKILVDGADKTAEFGGTVNFTPGMTLQWDSGTEAVGTISVVYTNDKGISTLLAEKTIGKAGSGGGDIKILKINGMKFDLSDYWGGEWKDIVEEAKNLPNNWNTITLIRHKIYYDDEEYWFNLNEGLSLRKDEAALDPSLSEFNLNLTQPDQMTHIILTRVLTPDNTTGNPWNDERTFNDDVRPVNKGTLYCSEMKLYVYNKDEPSTIFSSGHINDGEWIQIGAQIANSPFFTSTFLGYYPEESVTTGTHHFP